MIHFSIQSDFSLGLKKKEQWTNAMEEFNERNESMSNDD